MAGLKTGDVVVVTKLDRLGRSTRELLDLIDRGLATLSALLRRQKSGGGVDKEREGFGFAKSVLARFPKQPSYREAKRPQAAEEAAH
jgi:Resolvase, N terminal domain